jgi:hypothetical protein
MVILKNNIILCLEERKMPRKKTEEVVDGIFMEPVPISLGDEVKIKYKGLLADAGAHKVYLHIGFGSGTWDNIEDIPMRKSKDGAWSAKIQASEPSSLNFCFRVCTELG